MSNLINLQDYKKSQKPKKRMIDADIILEEIDRCLELPDNTQRDIVILMTIALYVDMLAGF